MGKTSGIKKQHLELNNSIAMHDIITSNGYPLSRRTFIKIAGTGMATACIGGLTGSLIPSDALAASPPVFGGTLKVGLDDDIFNLDPHVSTAQSSHIILHHICDSLLAIDESVTPRPNLAEHWEVLENGMKYRFDLKKGVLFHNGTEMTAKDVKYSLERAANPEIAKVASSHLKVMESLSIINDYSVELKMKEPFLPFLNVLANELMGPYIIPDGEGEKQGGKITAPVGTGPYKFVEHKPDRYVALKRFEDYRSPSEDKPSGFYGQKTAYLDELRFLPIAEPSVRLDALVANDIDFYFNVPGKDIKQLQKNKNITVHRSVGYQFTTINFNCSAPPLNDKKFRQALAYAVNKEEFIKVAQDGFALAGTNPIPPGHRWRTSALDNSAEFNLKKAKKLLKECNYNGEALEIKSTKSYYFMDMTAQVFQIQLRKIGIDLKVNYLDWGTMLTDFISGNYQCMSFGFTAKQDPNTWASENLWSKGLNLNRYGHPEIDELVEKGRNATTFEERKRIYDQIHLKTFGPEGDYPMIVTMHNDVLDATTKNVKGYKVWPMNFPVFYNVGLIPTKVRKRS